jgi:hypothetical protein
MGDNNIAIVSISYRCTPLLTLFMNSRIPPIYSSNFVLKTTYGSTPIYWVPWLTNHKPWRFYRRTTSICEFSLQFDASANVINLSYIFGHFVTINFFGFAAHLDHIFFCRSIVHIKTPIIVSTTPYNNHLFLFGDNLNLLVAIFLILSS